MSNDEAVPIIAAAGGDKTVGLVKIGTMLHRQAIRWNWLQKTEGC